MAPTAVRVDRRSNAEPGGIVLQADVVQMAGGVVAPV
jgi:hypothetical protein